MKQLLILLVFIFLLSKSILAQTISYAKISLSDSVLLNKFEKEFKTAINQKNKILLSRLFKYPFYCSPCLDYALATDSISATIKVTRKIFDSSVYKLFFELPIRNYSTKELWHKNFYFLSELNEKKLKIGYVISYTITPPSNSWEGLQGFIYLKKIKGKFIIESLDTVP